VTCHILPSTENLDIYYSGYLKAGTTHFTFSYCHWL